MISQETKTVFTDCLFENCKQERVRMDFFKLLESGEPNTPMHLLVMNKSTFKNVTFRDCCVEDAQSGSSVLKLFDSKVLNCRFENCKVSVNTHSSSVSSPTGVILDAETTDIKDCEFMECSSYGETSYGRYTHYYMYILRVVEGSTVGNVFKNCKCNGKDTSDVCFANYILAYFGSYEKNNSFENCKTSQCVYSSDYKHEMKTQLKDKPKI
jgi:hypothetical protein